PRAVHRFTETVTRSNSLFLGNSGRKTVSQFSWNCSRNPSTYPSHKNRKPAKANSPAGFCSSRPNCWLRTE
ncbi:hypothetical protein EOB49_33140, partial [Mesorhizobium sp. M7A.F.Ca.MR.148.00.0.0]